MTDDELRVLIREWLQAGAETPEMRLVSKSGAVEIWQVGDEWFVYGVTRDPRVCPLLGIRNATPVEFRDVLLSIARNA